MSGANTGMFEGASRTGSGRSRLEGPTWAVLVGCYGLWALALIFASELGWLFIVPAALAVAFHSSLQHEILHGHPTRNAALNEALIFPCLGLFIPYRRFRDLHLKHHNDERLTDPYDDPESFYVPCEAWERGCKITRVLLIFNATLAGRVLIGPALAMWGFWRSEARLALSGDRAVRDAWLRHIPAVGLVLAVVWMSGVPVWVYVLCAAYPGMSLIMIRSFIEHRADIRTGGRTAVIESNWFWRLLFLNNNFHAVHHERPSLSWYRIPALWRTERNRILQQNDGYCISGYGEVMRRWLWRRREPVAHPFLYRDGDRE